MRSMKANPRQMISRPLLLALLLAAAACAPAPLYTSGNARRGIAPYGEVPRDARGEPVWEAIPPPPANSQRPDPRTPATAEPESR